MKGNLVFNVIFVAVAIGVGVLLGLRPWPVYKEQRQAADGYRRDAQKAEYDRENFERQRNRYESSLGREELARQRGYKRKGETDFPIDE